LVLSPGGVLSFKEAPDHEMPAGGALKDINTYSVTIKATEGGNESEQSVQVTVSDLPDDAPQFNSTNTVQVDEGVLDTGYVALATPDVDDADIEYSLIDGNDSMLFTIHSETGALAFSSAQDHEGGQTVFTVDVLAEEENGQSATQTVTVTLNDVPDEAPEFVSDPSVTMDERETATGYTASAVPDVDGTPVTYSISNEADGGLFFLDDQGQLRFIDDPDHEAPGGGPERNSNTYSVVIVADDGTNTNKQTVEITVNDIRDTCPVFSSPTDFTINEGETATGYTANAPPDIDGTLVTYRTFNTECGLLSETNEQGGVDV